MSKKDAERAKNMFALGLLSWMYHRGTEGTEAFLREKFAKKPELAEANILAFRTGWNYGETTESFAVTYEVAPAALPTGTYRQITGNLALAYGVVAAGQLAEAAGVPGDLPDHPGLGRAPRAVQAQGHGRDDVPGRGRDRGRRRGAGRLVRRRARGHLDLRTRGGAEVGDHRAGGRARAAAADPRRPARRPLHRPADQDRAGRPAAGDVRAQRRGPGPDRRAGVAERVLRRRASRPRGSR